MDTDLPNPRIRALRDADLGYGFLPWAKGPEWETLEYHHFALLVPEYSHLSYAIPAGYRFNKASTPPLLWGPPFNYTPDGLGTVPALEHDFLCDLLTGGSDWLRERFQGDLPKHPPAPVVHEHFRLQLLRYGTRPAKANTWGKAVALIGPKGRLRFWSSQS